jgi:hypothetical protein
MATRRRGYVAGQFYPDTAAECIREIDMYAKAPDVEFDGAPVAGVVPHAGWIFSGPTAGKVFAFFKERANPRTFILYGAAHRFMGGRPVIMGSGVWETPLGDVEVDSELANELIREIGGLEEGSMPHNGEHSIEVQVPFIKRLFPEAKIAPILVPPNELAAGFGEAVGRVAACRGGVAAVASSDLTHYGFEYGFAPKGIGQEALDWARDVNDRRIIDLAVGMDAEAIVAEAHTHHNACGAGAIAAATATARVLGGKKGVLLEYTTSHDVMPRGRPSMFVGYAGIVF